MTKIIIDGQEVEIGGKNGKSAYDYAVDGGYEGTEEEFQEMMADVATKTYVDNAITGAMEASY